jgi:transposase
MPGRSKLTADAAERAVLRALSKSEQRGEADRARAILLTLEGRKAEEIAAVLGVHVSTVRNWRGYFAHSGVAGLRRRQRPGQRAKIGPHAGAIAAAILNEDTRHDGGWTLGRLCAEIARRGGPAISPRWLSHQLRQRGLCGRPPRVKSAFESELPCRLRVCVRPVRAATWPLAQMGVRLPKLPFRLRAERASLWHGLSPGVVRPTVHALLRLGLSEAALCR